MNITAVIIDSARQIDQLFSCACAEMSAEHTSGWQTCLLRLGAFGVDTTAIADSRVDCWSIAVWRISLLRFTKMTGASGETADQQRRFTITAKTITWLGLPLTSSLLLEYSSEYLSEYSSTR